MKHLYRVPFAYERYGRITVEAESREEAINLAAKELEGMTVSEMEGASDYLENSEEIDEEGNILDGDGNVVD